MRILTLALFLVVASAPIAANAEPPPSQLLVAVPVQDQTTPQLDAIVVVQADTFSAYSSSTVDTAQVVADKEGGLSPGFWILIAGVVALGGYLAYRYFTRGDSTDLSPRATGSEPPERTRPPGQSGRGSGKP